MVALTSTRWRLEARLKRTKANSPICARDIPTYTNTTIQHLSMTELLERSNINMTTNPTYKE